MSVPSWSTGLFIIAAFSFQARATVTVQSVGGAVSGSVVTSSEVTIIQSAQGTACTTGSETETCDNCTSSVTFGDFCSTKFAASTKYILINYTSTAAGTMSVTKTLDNQNIPLNGSQTAVAANTTQQAKLRWSDIETALFSSTTNSGTLKLNVDSASVTMTFKRQASVTGGNNSDCTTNSFGACDFRIFPGDEKAYLELDIDTGFPTNSDGLDFAGVRVYYREISQSDITANCIQRDTTSACGISPAFTYGVDKFVDIDIGTDRSFEDALSGLENDKYYCFQVVNRTAAGDLGWGLNIDATTTRKCVSGAPSEVVGLLTETNNCFIATAAYGSPFKSKVKTLREFRDISSH